MESLLDIQALQEMIQQVERLNEKSVALWGKMNVAQMLLHCQSPLKVALGDLNLKRGLLGILLGAYAKRLFMKDKPFQKNLPTVTEFNTLKENPAFEKEKKDLIQLMQRFSDKGANFYEQKMHPFFGKMSSLEWDTLQWKHLDHHLRQFGV